MSSLDDAVDYLKSAQPGRQPLPLFAEISRIATLPTYEIIPLRRNPETGRVEILLTQRPSDDLWWPDMWHNPGSVLLASDELADTHDFGGPEARVFEGELAGAITVVSGPHFIDIERRSVQRGHEIAVITWAEVSGEPTVGKYYDVDNLPENIMQHQLPSFKAAVAAFDQA